MLIAIGTRGDIEPFLAVGELLLKSGHEVVGLFPDQYRSLTKESGIKFLPFDAGFIEMIEGDVGKQAMGGAKNLIGRIKAYYRLYKSAKAVNQRIFKEQIDFIAQENPDKIIHSIKATVPVQWGYVTGKPSITLSPIPCVNHPIKNKSSIAFRGRNFGKTINRWTFQFTRYATIKNLRAYLKKYKQQDPGQKALVNALLNEPAVFTVSPSFFELEGTPSHVHYLGYQERNKERHWKPSEALQQFILRHKRFMFITFGSMSNPEPAQKTSMLLSTLTKLNIPAIINTAGGGLEEPKAYDDENFHFVNAIPYDWVLPKAHAALHHGGSGTTHLSVKYGCATTIIPHIIDQYFWNNQLSEIGVGPKGISIARMSEENLKDMLTALWFNPAYKSTAEALSREMKQEDFESQILKVLTA